MVTIRTHANGLSRESVRLLRLMGNGNEWKYCSDLSSRSSLYALEISLYALEISHFNYFLGLGFSCMFPSCGPLSASQCSVFDS
jgi:hypothetical protein